MRRHKSALRSAKLFPGDSTNRPAAREGCGRATLLRADIGLSYADFLKEISLSAARATVEIAQGGVSVTRTVHQLLSNTLSRFVITAVGKT
jgi:hypothetical protein